MKRPITHDYTDPSSSLGVSNKKLCTNSQTEFTRKFLSVTLATILYMLQRYETQNKTFRYGGCDIAEASMPVHAWDHIQGSVILEGF